MDSRARERRVLHVELEPAANAADIRASARKPIDHLPGALGRLRLDAHAGLQLAVEQCNVEKRLAYERELQVNAGKLLADHERPRHLARAGEALAEEHVSAPVVGRLQAEHLERIGV